MHARFTHSSPCTQSQATADWEVHPGEINEANEFMGGSPVRSAMVIASNTERGGRGGERGEKSKRKEERKWKRKIIYLFKLVWIYKFNSYFYYKKQDIKQQLTLTLIQVNK